MNFVLVGHGSIGSRYKETILKLKASEDRLIIIDNNKSLLEKLKGEGLTCFESLNEIEADEITYGIVSNWGPDHIKTANKLVDLGCKRLIIEKPLSHRKDILTLFKERCLKENIFVTIHYHWPHTNILQIIKKAEIEFDLGNPKGIRIMGGSVCLSTNGTHYFDLSCDLIGSLPKNVIANLELDYINPRDKNLLNIGGMAAYTMDNNTFINVSFSNENSESIRLEILYRNSIIELTSDMKLRCLKRNMEEVNKYNDKITRYGKMHLVNEIEFTDISTVEIVLKNLIFGKIPSVPLQKAEVSTLMVLGAIQSHMQGKRVDYDNIKDMGLNIS